MENETQPTRNKTVEALARIIKDTQHGNIGWRVSTFLEPKDLDISPNDRVDQIFEADYNDRRLVLYRKAFEVVPNFVDRIGIMGLMNRPDRHWAETVVLELLDSQNVSTQPFSGIRALEDLLRAVKNYISKPNEFIDSLVDH